MAHDSTLARRAAVLAVQAAMLVVALLLGLALLYLRRGSLELFPTAEQSDKVRIVMTTAAAVLGGLEVVLWLILRRLRDGGRGVPPSEHQAPSRGGPPQMK